MFSMVRKEFLTEKISAHRLNERNNASTRARNPPTSKNIQISMKPTLVPLPPLAFCHGLHRMHRNDQLTQTRNYLPTQLKLQCRHVIYKNNESVSFQGSSSFLLAEVGSIEAEDNARSDASSEKQHDLPVPLTKTAAVASSEELAADPSMFFELMSPVASAKPDQMSASSLAYLGDVVFELFIRSRYVWPSRRMSNLQDKVVTVVRGKLHFTCITAINRHRSQQYPHPPPSSSLLLE
jgi:hypothetical protein